MNNRAINIILIPPFIIVAGTSNKKRKNEKDIIKSTGCYLTHDINGEKNYLNERSREYNRNALTPF